MRKILLAALSLMLGQSAFAAKVVYVPDADKATGQHLNALYHRVAAQDPGPSPVAEVAGQDIRWFASHLPISKTTLLQVATSNICVVNQSNGAGCLVNEGNGITSFQVVDKGYKRTVYQTTFAYSPELSPDADSVMARDGGPTIYTWTAPSHSWGICGLHANLSGWSFHLLVGGRHLEGTGHLSCAGFDGSHERRPISMDIFGLGVGLGGTRVDNATVIGSGIGVSESIDELYGRYNVIDARFNFIVGGLGAGVGFHVTKGSLVFPLVLEGIGGFGLEVAADWNFVDIAPVNPQ